MKNEFWLSCWENNAIGFHEGKPNELLIHQFHEFKKQLQGQRLFIPLCGKAIDIQWLMSQGYTIVGVELSEIAINALFELLKITPTITQLDLFKHYSAKNIDIYVGDIFDLTAQIIGSIHGTYDRAAAVALPHNLRTRYAEHLIQITQHSPQLLVTFDYNPELMDGPPFSIPKKELDRLYSMHYDIHRLASQPAKLLIFK